MTVYVEFKNGVPNYVVLLFNHVPPLHESVIEEMYSIAECVEWIDYRHDDRRLDVCLDTSILGDWLEYERTKLRVVDAVLAILQRLGVE